MKTFPNELCRDAQYRMEVSAEGWNKYNCHDSRWNCIRNTNTSNKNILSLIILLKYPNKKKNFYLVVFFVFSWHRGFSHFHLFSSLFFEWTFRVKPIQWIYIYFRKFRSELSFSFICFSVLFLTFLIVSSNSFNFHVLAILHSHSEYVLCIQYTFDLNWFGIAILWYSTK